MPHTEKLRIALLADADHPDVQKLSAAIAAAGHEIHLFSLTRSSRTPTGVVRHQVPHQPLPRKFGYILAAPWLRWALQQLQPDILHAFFATGCGTLATLSGYQPLIISTAGRDILETPYISPLMRQVIRRNFQQAALVTALAPHMAAAIHDVGCAAEKVLTLPFLGIDAQSYLPYNPPADTLEIVVTRSLEPIYRHDWVLRAAAQLRDEFPAMRLRFYGRGTKEAELRTLTTALKLDGVASFPGRVAPTEIPRILSGVHVYVTAVPVDGVSSSLLEVMAAGPFPVVCDTPANRWWIEDGVNGLLVPPDDEAALVSALRRALTDHALRQRATQHNQMLVRERADLHTNVGQLISHYYKVRDSHSQAVNPLQKAAG